MSFEGKLLPSEPGFRSSVCKSVDTYLRGASCLIFIPERLVPRSNEIACNLRSEFLSPPLFPPRPGIHVHPGRSDVSLTLIQR